MTNLEALTASVNYPIDTIKIQKILIDNSLSDSDTYLGTSKEFDLATASLYALIVTSANLSEGDFSLSITEKNSLIALASGLYSKHGVANPLVNNSIVNKTNYW